jgi:phosphoglycerate dehydrogenase-like enzyme
VAVREAVAAEREKVAEWMMARAYATGHGETTEELLEELGWQIEEKIAREREACALEVEKAGIEGYGTLAAAAAIRARADYGL